MDQPTPASQAQPVSPRANEISLESFLEATVSAVLRATKSQDLTGAAPELLSNQPAAGAPAAGTPHVPGLRPIIIGIVIDPRVNQF
jgi:hypothetical protein